MVTRDVGIQLASDGVIAVPKGIDAETFVDSPAIDFKARDYTRVPVSVENSFWTLVGRIRSTYSEFVKAHPGDVFNMQANIRFEGQSSCSRCIHTTNPPAATPPRSPIHSLVHSFACSLVRLFTRLFVRSFTRPPSPSHPLTHSPTHPPCLVSPHSSLPAFPLFNVSFWAVLHCADNDDRADDDDDDDDDCSDNSTSDSGGSAMKFAFGYLQQAGAGSSQAISGGHLVTPRLLGSVIGLNPLANGVFVLMGSRHAIDGWLRLHGSVALQAQYSPGDEPRLAQLVGLAFTGGVAVELHHIDASGQAAASSRAGYAVSISHLLPSLVKPRDGYQLVFRLARPGDYKPARHIEQQHVVATESNTTFPITGMVLASGCLLGDIELLLRQHPKGWHTLVERNRPTERKLRERFASAAAASSQPSEAAAPPSYDAAMAADHPDPGQ
ncbi:hypothetical protein GQ42DRAFT_39262 [Ramicandelaber brevisporus]|nr:hypothetical protein GQ42DRAFT_39262 [Ramicandelaber brevisporus]